MTADAASDRTRAAGSPFLPGVSEEPSALPIFVRTPNPGAEVKAHIGRHPCRRVLVSVHFAGEQRQRRFVPSATVRSVRRWALGLHGFDLPTDEQPRYEVGVCDSGVIADRNDHIGALATRCRLCLDLAPRERFLR